MYRAVERLIWTLIEIDPPGPVAHPDGHDGPGLVGELIPGIAAVIDDIVAASENPVREPVLAQQAPAVHARDGGSPRPAAPLSRSASP